MFNLSKKILHFAICAVLITQLTGCGTLMYPERKGQRSGKIDPGVAVLNGIGLLLFIIPGVIAFAVDFNNGTIYLPGTSRSSLDINTMKQVNFDPKRSNLDIIATIIKAQTGQIVSLKAENVMISKLHSIDDMLTQFSKVAMGAPHDRIALLERR